VAKGVVYNSTTDYPKGFKYCIYLYSQVISHCANSWHAVLCGNWRLHETVKLLANGARVLSYTLTDTAWSWLIGVKFVVI